MKQREIRQTCTHKKFVREQVLFNDGCSGRLKASWVDVDDHSAYFEDQQQDNCNKTSVHIRNDLGLFFKPSKRSCGSASIVCSVKQGIARVDSFPLYSVRGARQGFQFCHSSSWIIARLVLSVWHCCTCRLTASRASPPGLTDSGGRARPDFKLPKFTAVRPDVSAGVGERIKLGCFARAQKSTRAQLKWH